MTKPTKEITFNNLQEQKKYIQKAIKENKWEIINEIKRRQPTNKNFYGNTNLDKTLTAIDYGLNNYTEKFIENLKETNQQTQTNEEIFLDTQGFAYDIGSVVQGIPECCINTGAPKTKKIIKILVDISFNCTTTAEEIMNRAIAITNLINTITIKKNIIKISFFDFNIQDDINTLILTNINTEIISPATIAFISSPQFFRQISWITTDELRNKDSTGGRGHSKLTDYIKDKIKKDNAFFIGGYYSDDKVKKGIYKTINSANDYITELFNNYCNNKSAFC